MPTANTTFARAQMEISRLRREIEVLRCELSESRGREDRLMQAQCRLIDEALSAEARHKREEEAWATARAYLVARDEVLRGDEDHDDSDGCFGSGFAGESGSGGERKRAGCDRNDNDETSDRLDADADARRD